MLIACMVAAITRTLRSLRTRPKRDVVEVVEEPELKGERRWFAGFCSVSSRSVSRSSRFLPRRGKERFSPEVAKPEGLREGLKSAIASLVEIPELLLKEIRIKSGSGSSTCG